MNYKPDVRLRRTEVAVLDTFFQFQLDTEACYLAAFTPKDPTDRTAYLSKHAKLLDEPTVNNQTIIVNRVIAGSIAKFKIAGEAEITYWIDKNPSLLLNRPDRFLGG